MSQTCPICGKAVDPLRARAVGVRDGKVVAYCSTECARAAETKPTPMPAELVAKPAEKPAEKKADKVEKPVEKSAERPADKPAVKPVEKKADEPVAKKADKPVEKKPVEKKPAEKKQEPPPARAVLEQRTAHADDTELVPKKSRALPALAAVVVLGGGGAFLAYKYLAKPAAEAPATPQVASNAPPAIDAPPIDAVATAEEAVAKAKDVLAQGLVAGTPRVQRVAAAALARTGDPEAIQLLAAALAKETTDAAKLELAYALARGGDKRGIDVLVEGLSSPRRDAKLEAGRLLAQLGDKRAIHTLENYLPVTQLRLGAAETLANFAEPRAVEILDKVRADAKTSPDDRARATIALGIAGRTDVAPDLHELLKVDGFNAFAASALARLKDPAARPVLVGLLAIPSLRVEAARSLRVLDPAADTTAERVTLLGAMAGEKDTFQIQAAEALLLLAGDPAWSEHP